MSNVSGNKFYETAVDSRWALEHAFLAGFPRPTFETLKTGLISMDDMFRSRTVPNEVAIKAATALADQLTKAAAEAKVPAHVADAIAKVNAVANAMIDTAVEAKIDAVHGAGTSKRAGRTLPPVGSEFTARARGTVMTGVTCKVVDGGIEYNGKKFGSFSAAAMECNAVHNLGYKAINGWEFWGAE